MLALRARLATFGRSNNDAILRNSIAFSAVIQKVELILKSDCAQMVALQ